MQPLLELFKLSERLIQVRRRLKVRIFGILLNSDWGSLELLGRLILAGVVVTLGLALWNF